MQWPSNKQAAPWGKGLLGRALRTLWESLPHILPAKAPEPPKPEWDVVAHGPPVEGVSLVERWRQGDAAGPSERASDPADNALNDLLNQRGRRR